MIIIARDTLVPGLEQSLFATILLQGFMQFWPLRNPQAKIHVLRCHGVRVT